MAQDQSNKPVALAIGAGDAIGAAFARRFARGGYTVVVARRDATRSAALVDELQAAGHACHARSVDARDEEQVIALITSVEQEIGPIEVCLYNAGSNSAFPLLETSSTMFRKIWDLACFGGFVTGREAARVMLPRGRGTILYTGATASIRGGAGFAAFASAKFGLRALAQSMARELGPNGIHVAHLVIDGGVDSAAIHARKKAANNGQDVQIAEDHLIDTDAIAETYWSLVHQHRSAWTHETDIRPFAEKW